MSFLPSPNRPQAARLLSLVGRFSLYLYDQTRAKPMKNYHEIPLHSSNNEQVLASKWRVPCQRAGKNRSCWLRGADAAVAIAEALHAGLKENSPNPTAPPRACSSPLPAMNAQKTTTRP